MSASSRLDKSIEQFEQEARNLLHGLRQRETTAIKVYFSFDPQAGNSQPGLADARYVVARAHGFRSWRELKERAQTGHRELVAKVGSAA